MLISPIRIHKPTLTRTEDPQEDSCAELDSGNRVCLLDHLLGLDQREKDRRFQCGASNSFITRYYLGINWERHIAIVWRRSGLVIGIAELASLANSWRQPELAISVAPCVDANYVRRHLIQAACAAALKRGAAEIIIWFGSEDDWVCRLASEYRGKLDRVRQYATIPLLGIENISSKRATSRRRSC